MKTRWVVWILLGVLTVLRGALALRGDITPEEAYWWLLGQKWEWASVSGPGGTAALAAGLDAMGGSVALRLVGPILLLLASLGLYVLVHGVGGSVAAAWAVAAFNLLPWTNLLSLTFGPELPALTAWIWLLAALVRASAGSHGELEEPWAWWCLAGAVWAVGLLFSYWLLGVVFLLPFLLVSRRRVSMVRLAGVLWMGLCGFLGIVGPLLWQIETEWIALSRQTWVSLRAWGEEKSLQALFNLFAGLGWTGAVALVVAAIWLLLGRRFVRGLRVVRGAVGIFFLLGLWALWNGRDLPLLQLFWVIPTLAVAAVGLARKESAESLRGWTGIAVGLACLGAGITSAIGVRSQASDPGRASWAEITPRLQRALSIHQAAGAAPLFLITDRGEHAAALAYYLQKAPPGGLVPQDFPPVFVRESQNVATQFALWPRYDEFVATAEAPDPYFAELRATNPYLGRHALYFAPESPADLPQVITNGFARVIPLEMLQTAQGNFYLYLCEDYQTAPL